MINIGDILEFQNGSCAIVYKLSNCGIADVLSSDGVIDQWANWGGYKIRSLADPMAPLNKLSPPQTTFILRLLGCQI